MDPTFTCVFVDDNEFSRIATVVVDECHNTEMPQDRKAHVLDRYKQGHTWLLRTRRHSVFDLDSLGIFYLPALGTAPAPESKSTEVAQGIIVLCDNKPSLKDYRKFDHLSES